MRKNNAEPSSAGHTGRAPRGALVTSGRAGSCVCLAATLPALSPLPYRFAGLRVSLYRLALYQDRRQALKVFFPCLPYVDRLARPSCPVYRVSLAWRQRIQRRLRRLGSPRSPRASLAGLALPACASCLPACASCACLPACRLRCLRWRLIEARKLETRKRKKPRGAHCRLRQWAPLGAFEFI